MSALPLKVDIKRGGSHVRLVPIVLTGDFGNVIEAAQTGVRQSDRLTVRKSSPSNFGLLQHNLPTTDIKTALPNH
jgi:hypothetical protein